MRKPIRYLAGLLALSQIYSANVLVAHANKTAMQTPNYSISIPESVHFGELHSDKNSTTDYTLSVSYHGTEHPAITVTAPENGTLYMGSDTLTFENNMPTATLTAGASTAIGSLSIGSEQVAQATEGDYVGTLHFTFTQSSESLDLSTEVEGDTASAQLSGNGILSGEHHENITVSDKHIAFDASSGVHGVAAAQLHIHQDTLHTIAGSGRELTIHTDLGSVAFDEKALAHIAKELEASNSAAPLQMNIAESDPHYVAGSVERSTDSGETMTVYELTLTLGEDKVSFDSGAISISVPCGEDMEWAYYILDGELEEQIPVTVVNGIGTFAVTHFSLWGLSSVDYFEEEKPPEEEFALEDGNYYVDLWLWHQYADQASMGDVAFEDNRQALVTVENSQVTRVEVATNTVDISGITSAVEFLEVEGEEITTLETDLFTTSTNDLTFEYIVRGEFTMPDKGQPTAEDDITYLNVRLAVPDTPMDATADADGCMSARFKFDWVTAQATKDSSLGEEEKEEKEEADVSETVTLTATVDTKGNATLTIDQDVLKDVLKLIKENMEKNDDDEATSLLTIKIDHKGDINSLNLTIEKNAFQSVMKGVDVLRITSSMANLRFDGDAMTSIWSHGENNIKLSLQNQDIEELTAEEDTVRDLVGDKPVLGMSITNGKTALTQVEGAMTVSIPYKPEEGTNTIKLTVYHPTEEGTWAEIPGTYYSAGYMVLTDSQLYSSYAVAYDENRQLYLDVPPTAWFYDAVTFVTQRELFTGTAFQIFSPQDFMNRAMMVTVLHRMAGEPTVGGYSYYDDVAVNQWYSQGVLWSSQNRIVEGYGNRLFGTIDNVTREQVAVILYRYAGKFGYPTASDLAVLEGYSDSEAISSWANYAMAWAVEHGLITGVTETTLDPQGTATRAQVATIFMRFAQ